MTTAMNPSALHAVPAQVVRFACVGAASTVVHLSLFALMRHGWGTQAANLVALVLATLVNTTLNRRFTFGVTTARHLGRHHAQAMLVFGLTWATSAVALGALPLLFSDPSTVASTTALAGSMALSMVARFVLMRTWIFRPA